MNESRPPIETHYVYCDISHRNGRTCGAYIVDSGEPRIRQLSKRLDSNAAEVAFITMIVSELPKTGFYVICNDTTTLNTMRCGERFCFGDEFLRPMERLIGKLREALESRSNVMLWFMSDGDRPWQYQACHLAARKAAGGNRAKGIA